MFQITSLLFFISLLLQFASFQSLEDILKNKDESNVKINLNDISILSRKYSDDIKPYNSRSISLIQDDMVENRKKRQEQPKRKIKKRKPSRKPRRKPVDKFAQYKAMLLKTMNEERKLRHANPLQVNSTIAKEAQDQAKNILSSNFTIERYHGPLGEIYDVKKIGEKKSPFDVWFQSKEYYHNYLQQDNFVFSMLTQIVWKATKQVGCGVAENEKYQVTICRFYPKGNIKGEYEENVENS